MLDGKLLSMRYPGGKLRCTLLFLVLLNRIKDHCIYVEPFAGGANIAWSLLIDGVVDFIIINDADRAVYSFWQRHYRIYALVYRKSRKRSCYS